MVSSRRTPNGQPLLSDSQSDAFAAKISTLKPSSGDMRAEQIRDVIDAFRRLRSSVQRFVHMFVAARDDGAAGELGTAPLPALLSMLSNEAQAARFTRLRELKVAIKQARTLERTRDAVFSESFSNDLLAMSATVTALERVDAVLVGLCVESVLERYVSATSRSDPPDPASHHVRKRHAASVY